MSDTANAAEEAAKNAAEEAAENAATRKAVNRGGLIVLVFIMLSLLWYLLSDRHTPSTSQARIDAYIVGVAPKVAGLVTDVWVNNNERVVAGQVLFQIDSSLYRIALDKARADFESTVKQVRAGDATVEAARSQLRAVQANELKARQDAERLQRLYEQDSGTISVRRLEIAQATLEQSQAAVAAAQADIRRAIEQMGGRDAENNTMLKTALVGIQKAELDLSNTTVRAPIAGIITDLQTEVGRFAGTGAPVLTLVAMDNLWVTAEFTENNLGNMRPGQKADILFDVHPGELFEGSVSSIGYGVSGGRSPQPGTLPTVQNDRDWLRQAQRFPVTIEFNPDQEEGLRDQLRIGGQATVTVYTTDSGILNVLARIYLKLMSWFSYAY